MYLRGYDLENLKTVLLHHFDDWLPWKQSKMATKHNQLKVYNPEAIACRLIFLLQLVPSLYQDFEVIVLFLYYLRFMLVKRIPIIFKISIKVKQILPSTNPSVKVKVTFTDII